METTPRFKKGDKCKVVATSTVVIDDTTLTLYDEMVDRVVEIDELVCNEEDYIVYSVIDRVDNCIRYVPDNLMELE